MILHSFAVSNSRVYSDDEFDLWPVYSSERFRPSWSSCSNIPSEFCLKLTIGKVHDLFQCKNEENVSQKKNNRNLKFAIFSMEREIIVIFEKNLQFSSVSR